VADQFADAGHKVTYIGAVHAMAMARPDDLNRCVTNLVENATRFGTETTIRLTLTAAGAVIEVEDDGPGISEGHKQNMLKPFVRGDRARNMDDATGFGLGLSIAQTIVLAHGGELSLLDRNQHGLLVRVVLPTHAEDRRSAA
jgi:signal transduction histidine kinase